MIQKCLGNLMLQYIEIYHGKNININKVIEKFEIIIYLYKYCLILLKYSLNLYNNKLMY